MGKGRVINKSGSKHHILPITVSVCLCVFLIFLVIVAVIRIVRYVRASDVCQAIREGTYTHTTMGDGLSLPVWFAYLMSPITHFDFLSPEIPLVVACEEGDYNAVCDLLANGADPNYTISGYWTAIQATYLAPYRYDEEQERIRLRIAEKLVEYGADVTLQSSETEAIFIEARFLGHEKENPVIVESLIFLLDNGASLSDKNGESLLHIASAKNASGFAGILLEKYGADPNGKTVTGETPLMTAARFNAIETARLLIEYNADLTLRDAEGKTAYDYAVENGYADLAELLKP